MKDIKFGSEAQEAIRAGVEKIAKAVSVTLGPRGRSVLIDRGYGSPTVTDDGVAVAREFELKDKFENMGAALIQEIANKTNDEAGDGTSTATVLASEMAAEGFKFLRKNEEFNAITLRDAISRAVADVVEALKKIAKPVKTQEEIEQVANIAALDGEVGKLIAEAIKETGKDGVVMVEEGKTMAIEKEIIKGMRVDRGFVSPYMINNPQRMEAVWENTLVMVTDKKLNNVQELVPLFEGISKANRGNALVIFADDIEGTALSTMIVNKLRGSFFILGVKAPGFGDRRRDLLGDIAAMTGATVISEETGLDFTNVTMDHLGAAVKVVATKDHTTVIDGGGKKAEIDKRVAAIRTQIVLVDSDFDREKLQDRLAKLTGGIGIIKVGANTETEMKAHKFKIEDALNATKAAIAEGIVAGGGVALVKITPLLEKKLETLKGEEKLGYEIVLRAITAPLRAMAENAGFEGPDTLVENIKKAKVNMGYDFSKPVGSELVNMFEAGIIDPVKVTRLALENAASVVGTLLTTEAAIINLPDPKLERGPAEMIAPPGM